VKKKIASDHKHIKHPMTTTSPAFDPERIAKIANIVPNFIDFAAPGDEIHLGLEGDPAMPTVYRGSERPTGHIVSIRGNRGERVVEVKLKSGTTMELAEPETSPFKVWEFTDDGYKGVLLRAETAAKERAEEEKKRAAAKEEKKSTKMTAYRGSRTNRQLSLIDQKFRGVVANQAAQQKQLRDEMTEVRKQVAHMHNIVLSVSDGLSRDIQALRNSKEPTFSGALLNEMKRSDNAGSTVKLTEKKGGKDVDHAPISFSDEEGDLSD
jgi:hypothetical protein